MSRIRFRLCSAGCARPVPGMPDIELDPELVLLIFLPPLLYSAASFSDLAALRADARAISLTAIGLVLLTIAVVGVIAHEVIGLPWPVAFALGAVVAPTDPVAATAIMRRLGAPRRVVNLVEGESLVNDASALVAFRVAAAAAVGGSFSALRRRWTSWARSRAASRSGSRGMGRGADPPPRRRSDDRRDHLVAHRIRGVPSRRGAPCVGCARGRDRRPLHGLARPDHRFRGGPAAERVHVGRADVPAQRHAVHPDRPTTAGHRRRARELRPGRGDRLFRARLRRGHRHAVPLAVHGSLPAPRARPPTPAA